MCNGRGLLVLKAYIHAYDQYSSLYTWIKFSIIQAEHAYNPK